jgi:hypothetical protein
MTVATLFKKNGENITGKFDEGRLITDGFFMLTDENNVIHLYPKETIEYFALTSNIEEYAAYLDQKGIKIDKGINKFKVSTDKTQLFVDSAFFCESIGDYVRFTTFGAPGYINEVFIQKENVNDIEVHSTETNQEKASLLFDKKLLEKIDMGDYYGEVVALLSILSSYDINEDDFLAIYESNYYTFNISTDFADAINLYIKSKSENQTDSTDLAEEYGDTISDDSISEWKSVKPEPVELFANDELSNLEPEPLKDEEDNSVETWKFEGSTAEDMAEEDNDSEYLNEENPVALEEVQPEEELDENSKQQVERIQKDLDDQNINLDMEKLIRTGKIAERYDQAVEEINRTIESVKGMDLEKIKYQMSYDNDLSDLYETFCEESDLELDSKISYDAFYAFVNS